MIFYNRLHVLVLLALSVVLPVVPAFSAETDLVAKVGGIPVTVYELQREQQKIMPFNVSFHGGVSKEKVDEVKEQALQKLIERAYKVQYALNEEIAVDNAAVDNQMKPLLEKFKSVKELDKATGKEGLSGYRASVYRQLLAEKAEEQAVDSKVNVTDKEVAEYYEKNKEAYKRPKQFKASHILIKVDPSSNSEERAVLLKKAEELVAKAKAGEDFYNLAYYNSDDRSKFVGGDLGYFHMGQTVKEFEDAILKMKVGQISDPVKTMFGYHIIKLDEVNEARQLSFEDAKGKIRESLEKKKREALYEKWMSGLKAKYQVQRF